MTEYWEHSGLDTGQGRHRANGTIRGHNNGAYFALFAGKKLIASVSAFQGLLFPPASCYSSQEHRPVLGLDHTDLHH